MNNQIFFFFYNLAHQSRIFDDVVVFFAVYFPYIVVLAAFLFLLFHPPAQAGHEVLGSKSPFTELIKKWKEFFIVFFSCGLAWIIAKVLKILFHTLRPFLALPNVHALFAETGYAFPSQHAVFLSALAFAILFSHKKAGYVFMFFALLVGIARIIGGVHFPIDILGGFILGYFVAVLVAYFAKNV